MIGALNCRITWQSRINEAASAMPAPANAPRSKILQLAKRAAGDLRRGQITADVQAVGLALSERPDAVVVVLDLLIAEVGKKRPDEALCEVLLFMVGQALEEARMALEGGGGDHAAGLVTEIRQTLTRAAEAGRLPPEVMLLLAQQFAAAKLDLGDELRALTVDLSEQAAAQAPMSGPEDVAAQFASLAEALDHDPFLIHRQLSEQIAAFLDEQRLVIVGSLATSDVASMREAALGWLLDPSPAVARQVAQGLSAAAKRAALSAESVERLVLMRPWLDEGLQAILDAAIRTCRQHGLQPAKKPAVQITSVLASGCDGSGAQSVFVALKRGRKHALASLLVKHGFGVRDAWIHEDLSRREIEQLLVQIESEIDVFDASPEIAQAIIAHRLADNLDRQEPPPFGLVQFLEAVSPSQIRPDRVDAGTLIAALLADVPAERLSAQAVAAALAASKLWPKEYAFVQSWFEPSDAAPRTAAKAGTKKQREEAVLRDIIAPRRGHWAELLAWTAKAAEDDGEGEECVDFALVARELLGDRPLTDIPLAGWIARNTVAVSAER
ncbi:hypothetical protein MKL09_24795 [Methylobacterium sp. J-048]|uniref:hypothetical protein n=1 Tax=Methylobacterium sp. J-048 TaxID=2836635 RepID=UPI001FB89E34|nr:hypothetical protein [Methylobacterium sp. J-048]MCJ2059736.1 hypothetical protein [Methylobacterium sp. J-048]